MHPQSPRMAFRSKRVFSNTFGNTLLPLAVTPPRATRPRASQPPTMMIRMVGGARQTTRSAERAGTKENKRGHRHNSEFQSFRVCFGLRGAWGGARSLKARFGPLTLGRSLSGPSSAVQSFRVSEFVLGPEALGVRSKSEGFHTRLKSPRAQAPPFRVSEFQSLFGAPGRL